MRKILFAVSLLVSTAAFTQPWETIKGNGILKKETRKMSDFTAVTANGSMNVLLNYGNSNDITIEADENILPYISTEVENGTLVIKTKKLTNLKTKSKITITASLTRLTALKLNGSGNVKGDGAFSNKGTTDIGISGSGNINLGFDNIDELNVSISGSGNLQLEGEGTDNITATISGSGNIDCSKVRCSNVFAKVSGSGNLKVYADKSIDAKVSGSGNIFYKGTASNINSKASGSGKIIKM